MYCKHCGKEINDDNLFCAFCGNQLNEAAADTSKPVTQKTNPKKQKKVEQEQNQDLFSANIFKGNDGILRWSYGMNMWKNPTILITVWKVFMLGAMFPVLLMTILTLVEDGIIDGIIIFFKMLFLMGSIMTGLVIIAYPIVAMMNGGSYQVVFELDAKGISHIQMEKQFKKNQMIKYIAVLAGAVAGNPKVAGAGLLAGVKQSSYSEFNKVKKIVANSRRHVIYLNESVQHNQVYVAKDDFEQIKTYIVGHCVNAIVIDK